MPWGNVSSLLGDKLNQALIATVVVAVICLYFMLSLDLHW
jgi:hypothetical protein